MIFSYNSDGTGVRLNVAATGDRLESNCTKSQRKWGMQDQYYTAPEGVLTPMAPEGKQAYDLQAEKDRVYSDMLHKLDNKESEENLKNFKYEGHTYISDEDSIHATKSNSEGRLGNLAIQTFLGTEEEGKWAVVEGYVPHTCESFITFADEYYKRGSNNFTTWFNHKKNLHAIYTDSTKTAQDILNYDYSGGWQ